MADDLAAQLAHAFTLAASRMADRSSFAYPTVQVRDRLADDLRKILPALDYSAGRRDEWIDSFDEPAYECPHSDPLCPCLGPDHTMARDAALPPAPATLTWHFRDDGTLVLTIRPNGTLPRPLVVYLGDDVLVDETDDDGPTICECSSGGHDAECEYASPAPETPLSAASFDDERFGDYGSPRGSL